MKKELFIFGVGDWSVIGTPSTVTKDVERYSLDFGTPSEIIRKINSKFRVL